MICFNHCLLDSKFKQYNGFSNMVAFMPQIFLLLNYSIKLLEMCFLCLNNILVCFFTNILHDSLMLHCGFPALHFRGLQWGHQRELKIYQAKVVVVAKWLFFSILPTLWTNQFYSCLLHILAAAQKKKELAEQIEDITKHIEVVCCQLYI